MIPCLNWVVAMLLACSVMLARAGESNQVTRVTASMELFRAVNEGAFEKVQIALTQGADPNQTNSVGRTPLLECVMAKDRTSVSNRVQIAEKLIAHKARVLTADAEGKTPLIHAAISGDLEMAKLLVKAGALVKARDASHHTAIFYSAKAGNREMTAFLAENGGLHTLVPADVKK